MLEALKGYFSINLNEYENININLEINKVLVITFAVFAVFVIFFNVYRGNIRTLTFQLVRHGAINENEAKTLAELGLTKKKVLKLLLTGDTLLTKVVARIGEKRYTPEEYKTLSKEEKEDKIDFSTALFYIRENQIDRAKMINEKYVTSLLRTVVSCVLIALIGMCIMACMPGILNVINNLLGKAAV